MKRSIALLGTAVLLMGCGDLPTIGDLRIGAGFAARTMCSGVFVSGRSEEDIWAVELNTETDPNLARMNIMVDQEAGTVNADFFGVGSALAVYRDGLGCTMAIEDDVATLQAVSAPMTAVKAEGRPWPLGDADDTRPLPDGVDGTALEAALDEAFAVPGTGRDPRTRAVVIVHDGRIVAERYAPGFDEDMPQYGASMSKTATNALVGLRVAAGVLSLDEDRLLPEWRSADDPRGAITLDHLMRMSSGLSFEEVYDGVSDATKMLYLQPDAAAYAASLGLTAEPGTVWSYSSGTTNILGKIVRNSFDGDEAAYLDFLRNDLFGRLGMESAVFETDEDGTFIGSSFLYTSARDWARLGLLYAQDGVWNGERLLPEGWVAYSRTPAPANETMIYGGQTWLRGAVSHESPAPVFEMRGFGGQFVSVVPEKQTVIVRLGWQIDDDAWDQDAFRERIMAALGEAV